MKGWHIAFALLPPNLSLGVGLGLDGQLVAIDESRLVALNLSINHALDIAAEADYGLEVAVIEDSADSGAIRQFLGEFGCCTESDGDIDHNFVTDWSTFSILLGSDRVGPWTICEATT